MTKSLDHFTIVAHDDHYLLQLTMNDGATIDILASFEQLDDLAEEIDRRLDDDEETEETPALSEQ